MAKFPRFAALSVAAVMIVAAACGARPAGGHRPRQPAAVDPAPRRRRHRRHDHGHVALGRR